MESQMLIIKQEVIDDNVNAKDTIRTNGLVENIDAQVKLENNLFEEYGNKLDINVNLNTNNIKKTVNYISKDNCIDEYYGNLMEECLTENKTFLGVTNHIKDHKMIKFLIDSYRRNEFLWDHFHDQFRDRVKRARFVIWINEEFKRRFNLTLAKDTIIRKWDNLRTVYKRECNHMALEGTNVSTLWYFKDLYFLNSLYGGKQAKSTTIMNDTIYRRRYSNLWNDVSTIKLLTLLKTYPCFYDRYNIDYQSKERRGEALQKISYGLKKILEVTAVQTSKRISQLRFDYSKQKQKRLLCEMTGQVFTPSYSYYENMLFMYGDVGPFKCDQCSILINSLREMETHLILHRSDILSSKSKITEYYCCHCQIYFDDLDQFKSHTLSHQKFIQGRYKKNIDAICVQLVSEI